MAIIEFLSHPGLKFVAEFSELETTSQPFGKLPNVVVETAPSRYRIPEDVLNGIEGKIHVRCTAGSVVVDGIVDLDNPDSNGICPIVSKEQIELARYTAANDSADAKKNFGIKFGRVSPGSALGDGDTT